MGYSQRELRPLRHLSIRVPWHDNGWNGTVCKAPKLNGACLRLERISKTRDDEAEAAIAGRHLKDLDESRWPCCVDERGMFMADYSYTRTKTHPYKSSSPKTHGHFGKTPLRFPPFSAPAVPFRWMFSKAMEDFGHEFEIDVDPEREPDLGFKTTWVQRLENQRALLDCFFDHIVREKSLCFFYAKEVPFVEDPKRVLIGVGRVLNIGKGIEYKYEKEGPVRAMLWERMIQHSIRHEFTDGFLLPYHAAIEYSLEDPEFDPSDIVAFAPGDRFGEFSYASEHVSHDGAIGALLACAGSIRRAENYLPAPWSRCLKWIDAQLSELWKMRGPCPGLGAALSAFGVDYGTFVAREIEARLEPNEDPWPYVDGIFGDPKSHLSPEGAREISGTLRQAWKKLPDERRALLKLLSRFELTPDQATVLYVQEVRSEAGIKIEDSEILSNPYRIYEATRQRLREPVSVWTVDRGAFPDRVVQEQHPLPEPSALDGGTDARRIRALTAQVLEEATGSGHTLAAAQDVVRRIRDLDLQPACPVTGDLMAVAEDDFGPEILEVGLEDETKAYQLSRLADVGDKIRRVVERRLKGKRLQVSEDWRALLDEHLGDPSPVDAEQEESAREEKAAALMEMAESRFSVLNGAAGTGKTTLLTLLCSQEDIAAGGVLLLAPTGKARVRMEQVAKEKNLSVRGFTVAQYLTPKGRYDCDTGIYHLSDRAVDDVGAETVIIDEASMLTEEMLGAVLETLKGVKRLILVGDPRQLPPIGAGRPFVDIVHHLAPENLDTMFPRVSGGYAELTVRRRQAGAVREDLQLAEWFSGSELTPGADDVFERVVKAEGSEHVTFVEWQSHEDLHEKIIRVLVEELNLLGPDDLKGFDRALGGVVQGDYSYFNRGCSPSAEAWQILSPNRGRGHGVSEMNRMIHERFRSRMMELAAQRFRKIPKPMGAEEIVYGDKVINLVNHPRSSVYPKDGAAGYIANGEIGIVTGQLKTRNMKGVPWLLKVEFSSQPGFSYDFRGRDFGDEVRPVLELAYALTIHKAQGSEFDLVILVIPEHGRLLRRELLYTALTRQRNRVVVLTQGNPMSLKQYTSDNWSEIATRLSNLFWDPRVVEVSGRFYEDRLIHRTRKNEMVRSKSEIIIADRLADLDVDYIYEKPLEIKGVTKYPDFTIEDDETGHRFIWEHCGMMYNPEYRARWEKKLQWYRKSGILPYEEGGGSEGILIVTEDSEAGGISSAEIEKLIREVIL